MSVLDDIKNVSDAAIGKLAAQFGDLPRPLLAAIGAGDMAVEQLAKLRVQLSEKVGEKLGDAPDLTSGLPSGEDVKAFAADLPGRAQKIVGDVAHQLEKLASEVPGKAQQMVADLPAKAQEVANSLGRENLRSTVDGYTQFVASVYGQLADRGGDTVAKAAAEHRSDDEASSKRRSKSDTKHVDSDVTKMPDAESGTSTPDAQSARAESAAKKPAAKKPTAKTAATKTAATKTAATKTAATKTAATKKPTAKASAAKKPTAKTPTATDAARDGVDTP